MASASFLQSSFLGGEWAPTYQGRAEDPRYSTALNTSLNGFPLEQGSWTRRPGTLFASTTHNGKPGRVVAFPFHDADPYALEFTDGLLRFYQGQELVTQAPLALASVGAGNPALFTTGSAHGYSNGDQVLFAFNTAQQKLGAAAILNRTLAIGLVSSTTFYLYDPVTSEGVSGANLSIVANTGTVAKIVSIATPYTNEIWKNIQVIPTGTDAYIVCAGLPIYHLQVTAWPTIDYPFFTFSFVQAAFIDGPYLDPPLNTTISVTAETGSSTVTISSVAGVNNGQGFVQTDVGRLIRIFQEPPNWDAATAYTANQSVSYPQQSAYVNGNVSYFTAYESSAAGNIPTTTPTEWNLNTSLPSWIWGTITSVTSSTVAVIAIVTNNPIGYLDFSTFQLGVFTNTPDITGSPVWPRCGTYYEGRLYLGGAVPNRWDASMSNFPTTFSTSDLGDDVVSDNNALSYTFNSNDAESMVWMHAFDSGIVCGTQAGEWLIQSGSTGPITPTNVQAARKTAYGCTNILPVTPGISLVFVQKYQRKIMELLVDVFTGRFIAPNLSEVAPHLSFPGIEEIAYQQELVPVIWARCTDGSLIGCTYRRVSAFTSEAPMFTSWHHHALGNGRLVESITVGPSAGGNLDTPAMVTNDPVTNVRHVEFMSNVFQTGNIMTDACFLDDAVVPPGVTLSPTSGGSPTEIILSGLWNLNGKTATAWIGGVDCGDFLVTNGSMTVPLGPIITQSYLQQLYQSGIAADSPYLVQDAFTQISFPVVVGLTYTSQGQILRPVAPQATGAQNGPSLGKTRRIHQLAVLVNNTQGLSLGTRFDRLRKWQPKSPGGTPYPLTALVNGVYWNTVEDDYNFDSMPCWQIDRPYPATICAVEGFIETQDR